MSEAQGVKCSCGEYEPFDGWVHAHWNDRIVFTCPKCFRRYKVFKGKVTKISDVWVAEAAAERVKAK